MREPTLPDFFLPFTMVSVDPVTGVATEALHQLGVQTVATLITGGWTRARTLYGDLLRSTDLCDAGLLATRVNWLREHASYASRIWLTAHSRIYIWLKAKREGTTPAAPALVHPRVALCMHQGHMTDMRQELIALDFDKPGSATREKIVHLMNKGLPKRCQIRELSRFVSRYMNEDVLCHVGFTRMLLCSLAGLYPHCDSMVPFGLQAALMAGTLYQARDSHSVSDWVKQPGLQSGCPANQHLCLFVLRENLCANIEDLPTLRVTLMRRRKWADFEDHTYIVMNKLRRRLYQQYTDDDKFSAQTICQTAGAILVELLDPLSERGKNQFDKAHDVTLVTALKAFNTLRGAHFAAVDALAGASMIAMQTRINEARLRVPPRVRGFEPRLRCLLEDAGSLPFIHTILRLVHGAGAASTLHTHLAALLGHNVHDYSVTEQELRSVVEQQSMSLHRLPESHMVAHTLAIDAAWSVAGGIRKLEHCGNLMVCSSCGEVKNALAMPPTRRLQCKRDTAPSVSCVRVAVDDDAKTLM